MIIYINNIKRILRKKVNLLFLIVIPVVLISFVSGISNSTFMNVGIVDKDNTEFSRAIIKSLQERSNVHLVNEDSINNKILEQTMDLGIIIEEGFTKDILGGKDTKVKTISIEGTDRTSALLYKLDSDINAAINIALASKGDVAAFNQGIEAYFKGVFNVDHKAVDRQGADSNGRIGQMGFLVMSMLFLAGMASSVMLEDKEKKVYYRVMAGPIKTRSFMLQNILSFYTICIIQIILTFGFMAYILRIDFGPNLYAMVIVSLIFSAMAVAMGVMLNTVSKNLRQFSVTMSMILPPMCMLGGCWWPVDFMPEILQKIGQFVPTTWIMRAYTKIIYGSSFINTINEILVLVGFAAVFTLFATWKKTDIAK